MCIGRIGNKRNGESGFFSEVMARFEVLMGGMRRVKQSSGPEY